MTVTLAYDPIGRLHQIAGGSTTRFLYDGADLIAEVDTSGTLLRRYVHGPGVDEPLVWYEGSGASDRRFLLADERGSIVAISNSSGTVTSVLSYDAYGDPAAGAVGRFQYTGQMWIAEAGLYHYKARVYHPKLGRFLQTDPIGVAGGMNLYGYTGNDPINATDPSGLVMCTGSRIDRPDADDCNGIAGWGCIGCAPLTYVPPVAAVGPNGECYDQSCRGGPLNVSLVNGGRTVRVCSSAAGICTEVPNPRSDSPTCTPGRDCITVTAQPIHRPPPNIYGGYFSSSGAGEVQVTCGPATPLCVYGLGKFLVDGLTIGLGITILLHESPVEAACEEQLDADLLACQVGASTQTLIPRNQFYRQCQGVAMVRYGECLGRGGPEFITTPPFNPNP